MDSDWFDSIDPAELDPELIERGFQFFSNLRNSNEATKFAERDAADRQRHLKRVRSPYVL